MKNYWTARRRQSDYNYLIAQGFHARRDGRWDHRVGYYKGDKSRPIFGATLIIENGTVSTSWSWGEKYIVAAIAKLDNLPSGKPKRVYTGPHDIWADKQRIFGSRSRTDGLGGNYRGRFEEPKTKDGYFAVEIYYKYNGCITPWLWEEYNREGQVVYSEVLKQVLQPCSDCGKVTESSTCGDCFSKAMSKCRY
jgi:hypothetical protein